MMFNRQTLAMRIILAASCYFIIRTITIKKEIEHLVNSGLVFRTKTAELEKLYGSDLKLYRKYFGREP